MRKITDIRDLLEGPPHPSEGLTLRGVAAESVTEHTVYPPENPEWVAKLPGDEGQHPLAATGSNPFPGKSVQEVSRLIRSGTLSRDEERKARAYIDTYQKWTGEAVYNPSMHEPDFPTEQQYYVRDDWQTRAPRAADEEDDFEIEF